MKKVWNIFSYILVAALACVVTLATESALGTPTDSKLDQVADLIEERFIGDVDRTQMEDAAASAMVASLGDRWSYYISAENYAAHEEQMNNAYVGIGITIQATEDSSGVLVVKVNAGGPAEEAGLQVGDVIVAVDGQDITDLSNDEVRNLVRGEENTQVAMDVRRGETVISLQVTRKQVMTEVATGTMLEDNIGLVTIVNFDSRCYDETIAAIEALLEQGAQALIFDVRNNPGGYKSELVKVLDYLLPEGPLFRSEDYRGNVSVDESDADCLEIPMAVLVNGDSYSAAEFFAAALSEYGVASIVGEPTCGKGYFQQTYQLSDGSAIGLSVGKYSTPNGVWLAEVGGLTPDVQVDVDDETYAAISAGILDPSEDPQIQAAIETLRRDDAATK